MSYRIEEKEAIRIVGIRIPLTEDMEENQRLVPPFWNSVLKGGHFQEICRLSNQSPHGVLGVTSYQSPGEIYYYIAAATDKPVPAKMFDYEIPAASWVIFDCNGHLKINNKAIHSQNDTSRWPVLKLQLT